jgi:RHS repeat-associated protein
MTRGATVAYNLRFPGQYYDVETAKHYNYFRDYDPAIGRYIQSDPIGLKGGPNTFAYVDGQPLGWVDPKGLASVCYGTPNISPHYWVCAGSSCGGLVPGKGSFGGMFGSSGSIRPEQPGVGSCTPVDDRKCDKPGFEKCMEDSINEQRGNRRYHLGTHNCADWAWEAIQTCRKTHCK